MKKRFAIVFSLIICITGLVLVSRAAGAKKYEVISSYANVLQSARADADVAAVLPRGQIVPVTKEQGDYLFVKKASDATSGWVHKSFLSCVDKSGKTDIAGIEAEQSEIILTDGETPFDESALKVFAVYENGERKEISGYKIYVPPVDEPGEKAAGYKKEGFVSFEDNGIYFSDSFSLTVLPVPVSAVQIESPPAKTAYIENQKLDLAGIKLRVTFSDGRADSIFGDKDITEENGFSLEDLSKPLIPGKKTVYINYKYGFSCSFGITVSEKKPVSLTPDDDYEIFAYSKDAVPDLGAVRLTLTYDNGETRALTASDCAIGCDPAEFIYGNKNPVTLTCEGLTVTVYVTLRDDAVTGISCVTPQTLLFRAGDDIDLTGLKVYLEYTSGKKEEIKDFSLSAVKPLQTGQQQVTVSYREYSTYPFTITITAAHRKGDINGDGEVTVDDARLALRHAVKLVKLDTNPLAAGDANRDGSITVDDARLILRVAVRLDSFITSMPKVIY